MAFTYPSDKICITATATVCAVIAVLASSAIPATAQNNKQRHPRAQQQAVAYYGDAPYICSPSGFGRTSTCVLRSQKVSGG